MTLALKNTGRNVFEIGAFDAKTYFSELLRKVQTGAVINISKNGKPVAVLQAKQDVQNKQALLAHQRIIDRSKRFSSMIDNNVTPLTSSDLKELKNDGRKY